MNYKAIKDGLSAIDTRISNERQEILSIIDVLFGNKKQIKLEINQPLASHNGETFAVDSIHNSENDEFDIQKPEVSGMNNDGVRFLAPLDELDTDTLLQIADSILTEKTKVIK